MTWFSDQKRGSRPFDDRGNANGPYAYEQTEPYGVSGGVGIVNGNVDDESWLGFLGVNGGLGEWTDLNGVVNYGANVEGGILKGGPNTSKSLTGVDAGFGTFSAGAYHNKNTTSLGAQANLAESSATIGDQENSIRGGVSMGSGLALRLHHGDADNDGVLEAGFGFDAGAYSFDVKSEALGRAWNFVSSLWSDPPTVDELPIGYDQGPLDGGMSRP